MDTKALAILIYQAGLSYRKTMRIYWIYLKTFLTSQWENGTKNVKNCLMLIVKQGEQLQWMKQRLSWKTTRFMSGMQLDADERSISAVHVSF